MEEERRDVIDSYLEFYWFKQCNRHFGPPLDKKWNFFPIVCLVFKKVCVGEARLHGSICVSLSQGFRVACSSIVAHGQGEGYVSGQALLA